MSDIRKALKEAGLLNSQQDRRLKHEERVKKKQLGRSGREAERKQKEEERRQQAEQKKVQTTQAQERFNEDASSAKAEKQLLQQVAESAIREGLGGPRRFHYREPDGALPYLAIGDPLSRRLEAGEVGLVRIEAGGRPLLVPRDQTLRLREAHPEMVLLLAGAP